ncbi:MAG: DUF4860 domain-containing protein [Clostridiales Family XIII bacterium]|jgi:hypothetical protein|nr:DUF4860 domain-containing protein [Clostridiales Family XIII bacterium]
MKRRHIVDILIVLALFGAYAAGALLLSAIGADVYKGAAKNMQENYDMRTGALYIAEKLRQSDVAGCVRMGKVSGADAVVLMDSRPGMGYETWIYVHDGDLCEITAPPGAEVQFSAGQAIMPMRGMELELVSGRMLRIKLTSPEGNVSNVDLSPRTDWAAAARAIPDAGAASGAGGGTGALPGAGAASGAEDGAGALPGDGAGVGLDAGAASGAGAGPDAGAAMGAGAVFEEVRR